MRCTEVAFVALTLTLFMSLRERVTLSRQIQQVGIEGHLID